MATTMKNETKIAYASITISMLTAITLIWTGWETRNHYRLIVAPLVVAEFNASPLENEWGLYLKNEGVGPAVINPKGVFVDGKRSSTKEALQQMIKDKILKQGGNYAYAPLENGSYLSEGGRKPLITFHPESVQKNTGGKFEQFIDCRIDIHYEWCSIYGECHDERTADGCEWESPQTPSAITIQDQKRIRSEQG